MEIFSTFLRDFRHTFNPQTKYPWGGVWSATNFYKKYHILIAAVTGLHISEINDSNLVDLFAIAEMTCEKIRSIDVDHGSVE
jgi:hypothetical protein